MSSNDDTVIRKIRDILASEVTPNGDLRKGEGKMFGVPTVVIIALLGGGGISYGGFQAIDKENGTTALRLAQANEEELKYRRDAIEAVPLITNDIEHIKKDVGDIGTSLKEFKKEQQQRYSSFEDAQRIRDERLYNAIERLRR